MKSVTEILLIKSQKNPYYYYYYQLNFLLSCHYYSSPGSLLDGEVVNDNVNIGDEVVQIV